MEYFINGNQIISNAIRQFHNHAQNVQAVVSVGHSSCKLDRLYD